MLRVCATSHARFAVIITLAGACFTPDDVDIGTESGSTTASGGTISDAGTTIATTAQSTTQTSHDSDQTSSDLCADGTEYVETCTESSSSDGRTNTSDTGSTGDHCEDEQCDASTSSTETGSNSSGVTDECPEHEKICDGDCIPEPNCCESSECESGYQCLNGSCEDITPPQVLLFSPNSGATGVESTADIIVTFSERMDQSTAESAFSISPTVPGELLFQWDDAGVELTISGASFAYQTGDSSETNARRYVVVIGADATDLQGNPLEAAVSTDFTTLRQISQAVSPVAVATWDSFGRSWDTCTGTTTQARVGWWVNAGSSGHRYVYIAYDPQVLGTPALLHDIESVILHTSQAAPTGDYYDGGRVYLEHMSPLQFIDTVSNETPLSVVGTLTSSYVTAPTIDATDPWLEAWREDASLIVFRLSEDSRNTSSSPTHTAEQGTYANFTCDGCSARVTYLVP